MKMLKANLDAYVRATKEGQILSQVDALLESYNNLQQNCQCIAHTSRLKIVRKSIDIVREPLTDDWEKNVIPKYYYVNIIKSQLG